MTDESGTSSEAPIADGDRPERHASNGTANDAAESSLRNELGDVLTERRRRLVLRCLETSETPMAVADLADEVVRRETDSSPTAVQEERERAYVSLYHTHLPKLAESNFVSFDRDRNLVDLSEDAEELPLDSVDTSADERSREDH